MRISKLSNLKVTSGLMLMQVLFVMTNNKNSNQSKQLKTVGCMWNKQLNQLKSHSLRYPTILLLILTIVRLKLNCIRWLKVINFNLNLQVLLMGMLLLFLQIKSQVNKIHLSLVLDIGKAIRICMQLIIKLQVFIFSDQLKACMTLNLTQKSVQFKLQNAQQSSNLSYGLQVLMPKLKVMQLLL